MNELRKRQARIQPIIKVRKVQVDEEMILLEQIRTDKVEAVKKLRDNQKLYMEGVEQVNKARKECDSKKLLTLEVGLDYVKSKWYKSLREVRTIEEKEKAQLAQLVNAQKNLKTIEKLSGRIGDEIAVQIQRDDQKNLDEIASKKFTANQK
ncbi:MAG: hypothetical protein HQK54_02790 [Oligoflexales bacterium]|nr:hypothetical protein [Oligoflexales bacterium]